MPQPHTEAAPRASAAALPIVCLYGVAWAAGLLCVAVPCWVLGLVLMKCGQMLILFGSTLRHRLEQAGNWIERK